jgi:hypothetical protein
VDGQHVTSLRGTYDELAAAFQKLIDDYVERTYPPRADAIRSVTRCCFCHRRRADVRRRLALWCGVRRG